jgi:hypothetical protein
VVAIGPSRRELPLRSASRLGERDNVTTSWTQAGPSAGTTASTSTTNVAKDLSKDIGESAASVAETAAEALASQAASSSPPRAPQLVAPTRWTLGDDFALALLGAGLGTLAALLEPLTEAGGSGGATGGTPAGDAALPHDAGEGRLMLAFPSAPDRLPAAELAELFTCLDGIWVVASAITTPPEVPRPRRQPDGDLATVAAHSEPAILTVRYGSLLQSVLAGGVGAAVTTALALALKADDMLLALGSLAARLEEKRAEARANTAAHRAAEAKDELKRLRCTLQAGVLGADSETYRMLSAAVASEYDRALRTVILQGNIASEVARDDVPSNPAELLARGLQYRDRVSEIAGPPEITLEADPPPVDGPVV